MTPGALHQVGALLRLRWQMARAPGVRLTVCLAGCLVGWLVLSSLRLAAAFPPPALDTAVELAPQMFLGFAVLAVVAPLTAGGGSEVVPPAQLVAFPVRPATQFLGGLLLAPLNLVWIVQLLLLTVETGCLTLGGSLAAGLVTTTAYVALVTVVGQSLAWLVVGLRQSRAGRRAVAAVAGLLGVLALAAVRSGRAADALAHSPARLVTDAVVAGGRHDLLAWSAVTASLLAGAAGAARAGSVVCGWALGRASDAPSHTRQVRRRRSRGSVLAELVALDRASVWRAPALRRGALVLALLPGLLAGAARVPWASLVVLPGLVAAGSGLLFGINAFSLDGSGALWLASLPVEPLLLARSKLLVLGETVGGSVLVSALTGALRSPGHPSPAELAAIVSAGPACTAVVVCTAFGLSVRSPHRADLLGPRDAVAPPGALVLASLWLAVPTALTGLLLGAGAQSGRWWLPPLLALPVMALAWLWLRRVLRHWADPGVRARVVQVVAAG